MERFHTLITAHSGAENTRENTLESVRALAACGADVLEVDVRRLDGRLVLSHDAPGAGAACDALEDCLRLAAGYEGLRVNLDLKHFGLAAEAARLAAECGMAGRTVLTGDVGADEQDAARAAGTEVWCNDSALTGDCPLLEQVSGRGLEVLNICYRDVNGVLLESARRLSVWTVNEEADLRRFLAAGVRNITTRQPSLALRLRGELEGER